MLELLILNKLINISIYDKYRYYIRIKKEEKELTNIYNVLDSLIKTYQRDISLEELKLAVLTSFPDYKDMFVTIETSNIGDDILKDKITELVERAQAYDLALLSIEVSEGRKPMSNVLDFYNKFETREHVEEATFITDDLEELYNETIHKPGLRWRLSTINKMLGSLRVGDFGFIFARPETGKTTFLSSETSFMAEQIPEDGGPILWINNIVPQY